MRPSVRGGMMATAAVAIVVAGMALVSSPAGADVVVNTQNRIGSYFTAYTYFWDCDEQAGCATRAPALHAHNTVDVTTWCENQCGAASDRFYGVIHGDHYFLGVEPVDLNPAVVAAGEHVEYWHYSDAYTKSQPVAKNQDSCAVPGGWTFTCKTTGPYNNPNESYWDPGIIGDGDVYTFDGTWEGGWGPGPWPAAWNNYGN